MSAHLEQRQQQNSLDQLANLNQLPGDLLTRLCSLDLTDAKTLQLYEKVESAAVKYRKVDIKARRYAHGVKRFASNTIQAFEGLQSGRYTLEVVFQDFTENMEDSQRDLTRPLEEVTSALENVADDVSNVIRESGILVSEYQHAGRRFEVMRDVTANVSRNQGVTSVLSSLPTLLGVSSTGFSAAIAVFSIVSQAAATWGAVEQRKMKRNEELLTALNNELREVHRIMQEQQFLLQLAYDILGLDMSNMERNAEKRLPRGQPTTHIVDRIIKTAKELEAMCRSFLGDHSGH